MTPAPFLPGFETALCGRARARAAARLAASELVPLRPGRSEPRALKRRPKPYSFLTKPRHNMYVPPHHNRPNSR